MNIKKISRPINNAKNSFVKWLKANNVEDLDVYKFDEDHDWHYYASVSGYVKDNLYTANFEFYKGHDEPYINYSDGENSYRNLSIECFLSLFD